MISYNDGSKYFCHLLNLPYDTGVLSFHDKIESNEWLGLTINIRLDDAINYLYENQREIIVLLKYLAVYNKAELFEHVINCFPEFDLSADTYVLLKIAIVNKSSGVVKFMIGYGVPTDAANNFAIKLLGGMNADILNFLIDSGADICIDDNYPIRSMYMDNSYNSRHAYQNLEIMDILIKNGADVNIHNGIVLKGALKSQCYDTIKLLIDNGADTTVISKDDIIVLMACDDLRIYMLLLEVGVDFSFINTVDIPDNYTKLTGMLEDHGIDPVKFYILACDKIGTW